MRRHAVPAARMSEKDLLEGVIKFAHMYGWLVAHFRPGMDSRGRWKTAVQGDGAGFPDLVLVHEKKGDLLFVELKRDRETTTEEQRRWGRALNHEVLPDGGGRYTVWRPVDLEHIAYRLAEPRDVNKGCGL